MSITAGSGTYKVDTVEDCVIGGKVNKKIIMHLLTTGTASVGATGTRGWSLGDENGKLEITFNGAAQPAVGDTITFTIA